MENAVIFNKEDSAFVFQCPHCAATVQVFLAETNCKIFRHAVMKASLEQVNPHASKDECDRLVSEDLVIGCCKPFSLVNKGSPESTNDWTVEICEYI